MEEPAMMARLTILGIVLGLLAPGAMAQVTLPALSPDCEAPSAAIAALAPMPRVAELISRRRPLNLLAIGSSSTTGVGASSPRRAYPAQLQIILNSALAGIPIRIVNRGVSGEVASSTAERLRTEAAIGKPDVVIWQVGTNDALARVPAEDFAATLRATIVWLKSNRVDIVLVGLQFGPGFARDAHYQAIRDVLSSVAAEEKILLIRRYAAMQYILANNKVQIVSEDGLHLNDLGYKCMAEHVAHGMLSSMPLARPAPAAGDGQKP